MTTTYPRRASHYAHRLTRLLFKSCAAQRIGHHAALLVVHIAHTEDAARYSGGVTFWNSQLSETLGFKSPKQLNNARKAAIDAGWLHYERSGTREVATYWTLIPAEFAEFDDRPIEDVAPIRSESGTNQAGILSVNGTNPQPILSEFGTSCGTNCGKLPNPIPVPKREKAPARFVPPSVEEVREFAADAKLAIEPEAFVDHYASNGWKVGKQSMKDWKASVRQWSRRQAAFSAARPPQAPAPTQYKQLTPPTRRKETPCPSTHQSAR